MSRVNFINCDTCGKRCDDTKSSYFQVIRFDFLGEDFFNNALKSDISINELEDYEEHFCSIKCLGVFYNKK